MTLGIVEIGSIISAIVIIVGTCYKTFNMCHRVLRTLEEFEESNKRNEMHIMKLGLFNEGLPLVDRIQCGKRYLELGGNGTGKIQYELLVRKMENSIDKKFNDNF